MFRDRDGHGTVGCKLSVRSSAGADEVGVGRALGVGREVEQHRDPQVPQCNSPSGGARAGRAAWPFSVRTWMRRALVADHPGVVRGSSAACRAGDERRTFGTDLDLDLDRAHLAAMLVGAADVEVPDRCAHRCAALRELLRQPLGELSGEVAAWEAEAEAGYDVEALKKRGRGRPGRGAEPSQVVALRLTLGELAAIDARAEGEGETRSEVIREALAASAA